MDNHISSADDFRRATEARKGEPRGVEHVVLPKSGLVVMLRRPAPMWFLLHGHLPMTLAARRDGARGSAAAGAIQTPEEFLELSNWIVDLMREVFVSPRLSLKPAVDEISPEWLAEEDANFIIRWAVGEVVSTGDRGQVTGDSETDPRHPAPDPGYYDLAGFRTRPGPAAVGAGGGGVRMPPEPLAQGDGDGSSD